jgi:hypothetical protein
MAEELRVRITGDSSDFNVALTDAQKSLVDFSKKAADIGRSMSLYVTTPLVAAGGYAIKMAASFNESLNKIDVAFKSSAQEVKDFAKTTIQTAGIAEGTALDMAANFGDMATSMGLGVGEAAKLSKSLVQLAGDLSSMKDVQVSVAQTALTGIFTGETESLKRLGIAMQQQNVENYALAKGYKITFDQLSQTEQIMWRYNYVMNATRNSQGDFLRTSESAANQMRKFGENTKQLSVDMGQVMLPAVTSIVSALNGAMEGFMGASDETKGFIVVLGGIAAATGPLLFLVGTIVPKVIEGFNLMSAAAVKFNLTLTSATGIIGLAALFGVAAKSAYDYAKALNPDNKLSEAQKKDANAIRQKNTEILASIELLKKQKAMAGGPVTGMNTAQGMSAQSFDIQIAAQQKLLAQNKLLLQGIKDKAAADQDASLKSDIEAQKEQERVKKLSEVLKNKNKVQKEEKDNLLEMQLLKLKMAALDESIAKKELKMAKFQAFGDTSNVKDLPTFAGDLVKHFEKFPAIGEKIMGITTNLGTLKSPLSVMDASVQASTQLQSDNLDQLALKYQAMLDMTNMVGDAAANAFTALGNSIVDSMGLAKTGLEGFAGQMMQTLVQLGAMVVKQLAMNLAASLGWATQSATQSGAATGPLAVFTTPAFISTAIGGVMAAFASIPKFAAGGIVSGPTMGLMGEYPGAKSNPEVIAPLSKLQGMLDQGNGGGGAMSGEFVLRGQDLVVALARAEKQRNRIG